MKNLILVAGARPNFMKISPLVDAIKKSNKTHKKKLRYTLVHTGQHYDVMMSKVFFQELRIPAPDVSLGVGSGTHAEQTGKIMTAFEKALRCLPCDGVVVVGDVNSTVACALTAAKLRIPVAHVEAGLRSFDRAMPEEINRLLTDAISDFLFTPSRDANFNLKREGIPAEKIFLVGDIMIDALLSHKAQAERRLISSRLGLADARGNIAPYILVTLHRPSNVDDKRLLKKIILSLKALSKTVPVILPLHPRTKKQVHAFNLQHHFEFYNTVKALNGNKLCALPPFGYLDFLHLMMRAALVITDSGGIQEETTFLKVPCITLRTTTERPVTLTEGTNVLTGHDMAAMLYHSKKALSGSFKRSRTPKYWDGQTAHRIVNVLRNS